MDGQTALPSPSRSRAPRQQQAPWHQLPHAGATETSPLPPQAVHALTASACSYCDIILRAGKNDLGVPHLRIADLPRGCLDCVLCCVPFEPRELADPADAAVWVESRRAPSTDETAPALPKTEAVAPALPRETSLPALVSDVPPVVPFVKVLGLNAGDGGGECAATCCKPET